MGIESLILGRLHFEPDHLTEQLLPGVLAMLNRVMDATPVEQLSHVSLNARDSQPPLHPRDDTFGEMNRESIRWQLGM